MKCPSCGAEIGNNKICDFCGTQISLGMQREIEQINKEGCPRCKSTNVSFERENQGEVRGKNQKVVIRRTVGLCKDCGYTWYPNDNDVPPKKRKTWLWVLGWICIFPLPLTLVLLKRKDMKPAIKYGIIAVAWLVYALIGIFGGDSDKKAENSANNVATPEIVEQETEEVVVFNDKEIILKDGHPKYYGSTKVAHSTWDGVPKGKIIFADSNEKSSDDTILVMGGYSQGEKNSVIRDIIIYPSHSIDLEDMSLDDALLIAKEYLPLDIIGEWYEYRNSRKIVPKDGVSKDTYYVVTYGLTDEGSKAYYGKKHSYSGSIDVIIQERVGSNGISSISIGFGTPRWMSSLDTNGYTTEEWAYNFIDDVQSTSLEFIENEALNTFFNFVVSNQELNSDEMKAYAESQGFIFELDQLGWGASTHEYVAYFKENPDDKVFVRYSNPQKENYADRFRTCSLEYNALSNILEYYSEWNRDNYSDQKYGYYVSDNYFETFEEAYQFLIAN